jgi:hypothetical protein
MSAEQEEKVVGLVGGLLAAPVSIVTNAVVAATIWGWFVVPLGVPAIGYAHAYGLCVVAWTFTYPFKPTASEDPSAYQAAIQAWAIILTKWVMLGVAYIAHLVAVAS